MNNKCQSNQRFRAIVTHQSSSLNKKNETNEGNILQTDDVMVLNMRVQNFKIDHQKFAAQEAFTDCKEIEEESEEDYDHIN